MNDDFYIGYLDHSPAGLSRRTRLAVLIATLAAGAVISYLAAAQESPEPGRFEYGIRRPFEGVLLLHPVPRIRTDGTNSDGGSILLVGAGKHGIPESVRAADGRRVRFEGSLIQAGSLRMVEMNSPESFRVLDPDGPPRVIDGPSPGEDVTLAGEIVDTKCHLGVMRPATGKVHRACAVRCLSGGVPPGLLARDASGNPVLVLLATGVPDAARLDPQWAGRTVHVTGRLASVDGIPTLTPRRFELAD